MKQTLARLYQPVEKYPFVHYFDAKFMRVYLEHETSTGKERILSSKITRDMGLHEIYDWIKVWDSIHRPINGQVKNFLVACATCYFVTGKVKICVRGSKQTQGGGIWHSQFVAYLRQLVDIAEVDFFDPAELKDTQVWDYGHSRIVTQWIDQPYNGDGTGYDVLIDDAWELGVGTLPLRPKSKFYSLKGMEEAQTPYIPFLHERETRMFSHAIPEGPSYCICAICRVCSSITWDYRSYQWLRDMCTTLGAQPCEGVTYVRGFNSDMLRRDVVLRDIMTQPVVEVRRPADFRAVMALREDHRVAVLSPVTVSMSPVAKRQFVEMGHEKLLTPTRNAPESYVVDRLAGKNIAFMGVEPSIIGVTPIARVVQDYRVTPVDVMFIANIELALTAPHSPVIYVQSMKSELYKLSNYSATGFQVKNFFEMVYNIKTLGVAEVRPFRRCAGEELEKSTLFRMVEEGSPLFVHYPLEEGEGYVLTRGVCIRGVWNFSLGPEGPGTLFLRGPAGISIPHVELIDFFDNGIDIPDDVRGNRYPNLHDFIVGKPKIDRGYCACHGIKIAGVCLVGCISQEERETRQYCVLTRCFVRHPTLRSVSMYRNHEVNNVVLDGETYKVSGSNRQTVGPVLDAWWKFMGFEGKYCTGVNLRDKWKVRDRIVLTYEASKSVMYDRDQEAKNVVPRNAHGRVKTKLSIQNNT